MDGVWASRAASLALVLAAVVLVVIERPAPAIVLVATAVALLFLVRREESKPMEGAVLAALSAVATDMGLKGDPHHIPTADGKVLLFLPADLHPRRFPRVARHAVSTRPGDGVGLLIPSIGQDLEDAWARMGPLPRGGGREAAAHSLRQALPAIGAATNVEVSAQGRRVQVRFTPAMEGPGSRLGRPLDAFCAMLVCRALGEPVKSLGRKSDGQRVVLELEAVPWPS